MNTNKGHYPNFLLGLTRISVIELRLESPGWFPLTLAARSDSAFRPPFILAGSVREYCLIVEGAYLSESEAEHALRDPFIEDWVEQTGHFKIHNMKEILITPGVTLGSLGVVMLDERLFEIASADPEHPLSESKAKGVAEALRRQDMFEEVKVEPREGEV